MTKDRRLGRGLAALLGTPVEESGNPDANQTAPRHVSRPEAIQQLSAEAQTRAAVAGHRASPITVPLVPAHDEDSTLSEPPRYPMTLDLDVNLIDPNPFQPRRQFNPAEIESLAESLREHQQLQPILVRKVGSRYQLISGERRLRATLHAKLPTIRAEVRLADDRLVAELAIIENLQRKDLNAIEKAMSFKRYITEHQCTQDELAQRLKIDRSTIANMMRLLELPELVTDAVQREEISAGHAKALLSLGSTKEQAIFLRKIQQEGWSVRETEAKVAEAVAEAAASEEGLLGVVPRRRPSKSDQLVALERDLKMSMGTKVEISQTGRGKGKITIHFTNVEEFERIRNMLANDRATRTKAA